MSEFIVKRKGGVHISRMLNADKYTKTLDDNNDTVKLLPPRRLESLKEHMVGVKIRNKILQHRKDDKYEEKEDNEDQKTNKKRDKTYNIKKELIRIDLDAVDKNEVFNDRKESDNIEKQGGMVVYSGYYHSPNSIYY